MNKKAEKEIEAIVDRHLETAEWVRQTTYPASIGCPNCGRYVEVVIPQGVSAQTFMALNSFVCGNCRCEIKAKK